MRTQHLNAHPQHGLGHSNYWSEYLNRQEKFGKIKTSYDRQIALFVFIATMALLMALSARIIQHDMKYDIRPGDPLQDTASRYIGIRHHF